ncbi:MAG: inorganic diphosphatase [Candidatus Anstonellales archaeon]
MNLWRDIPPGTPDKANIVIEIPRGSRNKYEYNRETGVIELDRVLFSSMHYPIDYGFIPQTYYDDDDPIDALFFSPFFSVTYPGVVVKGRLIGGFRMEDEKGVDDKLIFVPYEKVFPHQKRATLEHLPDSLKEEIKYFFSRYKDLENKKAEFKGWIDLEQATQIFNRAVQLYKERF